jgi:pimeloyl-ACP methyl ester carboxylesterase
LAQFTKQVELVCNFNSSAALSQIKTKTLIITGEEDLLFSTSEVVNAFSVVKRNKFVTLSHAGHALFIENQTDFIDEVISFIR